MSLRVGIPGVIVAVLVAGAVAPSVDSLAVDPLTKLVLVLAAACVGYLCVVHISRRRGQRLRARGPARRRAAHRRPLRPHAVRVRRQQRRRRRDPSFSIAHHITAAAWPVALVAMALLEVIARLIVVELRRRQLTTTHTPAPLAGSAC
jgi:hypothetical protein